ncbi:MAG: hypothetical protein Q8L13_17365, partial [Bradyrhizobium sp.]|uniref:hypothetical protein n=1 Tax=Bradyrhizobium sp. TaxID=376 RepID=UPI00272F4FE3
RGAARLVQRHREIADVEQGLVDGVHYDSLWIEASRLCRSLIPLIPFARQIHANLGLLVIYKL